MSETLCHVVHHNDIDYNLVSFNDKGETKYKYIPSGWALHGERLSLLPLNYDLVIVPGETPVLTVREIQTGKKRRQST